MLILKVPSHDVRVGVRHAMHLTASTGPPPRLDIHTNITTHSATCRWQQTLFLFFSKSLPQLKPQTNPHIIYTVCNDTISKGTWPPNFPDLSPCNLCFVGTISSSGDIMISCDFSQLSNYQIWSQISEWSWATELLSHSPTPSQSITKCTKHILES